MINFKVITYQKYRHRVNFFIEDESEVKNLINKELRSSFIVKILINNLVLYKMNMAKLFIYFKTNDINLLVDRVINDEKRKKWKNAKFWSNKNNLIKYYQNRIDEYKGLINIIKEKVKDQDGMYFLELDAKKELNVNVGEILKYLSNVEEINN